MRGWKKTAELMTLSLLAGSLAGCGTAVTGNAALIQEQTLPKDSEASETKTDSTGYPVVENGKIAVGDTAVTLEPEDEYTAWDQGSAVMVWLDDSGVTIEGQGATADGGKVTIESGGTYVLRGTLSDGTILVDAGDEDTVRLVLDGVEIHSRTSAPVDIKRRGKPSSAWRRGLSTL